MIIQKHTLKYFRTFLLIDSTWYILFSSSLSLLSPFFCCFCQFSSNTFPPEAVLGHFLSSVVIFLPILFASIADYYKLSPFKQFYCCITLFSLLSVVVIFCLLCLCFSYSISGLLVYSSLPFGHIDKVVFLVVVFE